MRFRRLFRFTSRTRAEIARDVREEVAFHLELRIRELETTCRRTYVPARRQAVADTALFLG